MKFSIKTFSIFLSLYRKSKRSLVLSYVLYISIRRYWTFQKTLSRVKYEMSKVINIRYKKRQLIIILPFIFFFWLWVWWKKKHVSFNTFCVERRDFLIHEFSTCLRCSHFLWFMRYFVRKWYYVDIHWNILRIRYIIF